MNTLHVISDFGSWDYAVDATGKTDVSLQLQSIFDELHDRGVRMVTFTFSPGVYRINHPLSLSFSSLKMQGEAHGGLDLHGMNTRSGTSLIFGKDCGPACITLYPEKDFCAFPSGQTPWDYATMKASFYGINFAGYNNTDVDTQKGFSRFCTREPNFRAFTWFPKPDRYQDVEAEGQRAIVLPVCKAGQKNEMLSIDHCYFTDLYVGLDIGCCDVSNIQNSWFGQMTYGIRYHHAGQAVMLHDTCFADLETAVQLNEPVMSTLHNNTFAYVSKCFLIRHADTINISSNVLKNLEAATGTSSCGGFLQVSDSCNITISGNTISQKLDSRFAAKPGSIGFAPSCYVHFKNCHHLNVFGNMFCTVQTEPIMCFEDCCHVLEHGNMITYAAEGTGCIVKGSCEDICLEQEEKIQ